MTILTKAKAWLIYRDHKLGAIEAEGAIKNLSEPEAEAYQTWADQFDTELAKLAVEANNEAAAILADNPIAVAELQSQKVYDWTAEDYIKLVSLFKGTKYEKLHLTSNFHVANNELLLELVKP